MSVVVVKLRTGAGLVNPRVFRAFASFCAFSTFFSFVITPCGAKTPEKMVNNVLVDHVKTNTLGKVDLYLSSQGARFETVDGRFAAICAPPTWELKLFSPKRKIVYCMDNNHIAINGLGVLSSPVAYEGYRTSREKDMLLHCSVLRIVVDCSKEKPIIHDTFIFQSRTKKVLRESILAISQDFKFERPLQNFVAFIFNQGTFAGLPLELKNIYQDAPAETTYSTLGLERKTVPAAKFVYPKGYKEVQDKNEVLISEEARDTLVDLFTSPSDAKKNANK